MGWQKGMEITYPESVSEYGKQEREPEQEVPVNPYFLGLWLGDGTRCSTAISNNHEAEIRNFLIQHAAELDLHLVWHKGLSYATVRRTRLADRPMPEATSDAVNRPAKRQARQTIIQQRLRAGWTVQPDRKPGETRIWYRPGEEREPSQELPILKEDTGAPSSKHLMSSPLSSVPVSPRRRRAGDYMPNLGSSFASSLVFNERSSSPVKSIPPNALSELRSDDKFMGIIGDSQINNSDEVSDSNIADNDITSKHNEDDDEEAPKEGHLHIRVQTGCHAYGDLQDNEQEQLINEITMHSNTSTTLGINTLLKALRKLEVFTPPPPPPRHVTGYEGDTKHVLLITMSSCCTERRGLGGSEQLVARSIRDEIGGSAYDI
ncbi:hypothetical protein FSHL1_005358 [Fusarium sambucinum]